MKDMKTKVTATFNEYIASFTKITPEQQRNFDIKRDHSLRVAAISETLAQKLGFTDDEINLAYICGLFHDIGRFRQLVEYNTFSDAKSVDHAELALSVIEENSLLIDMNDDDKEVVLIAIEQHNKIKLTGNLNEKQKRFAGLLRDADKLDIYKVLSDYYTDKKAVPNHTLTWELPAGNTVSPKVADEVLHNKLVSKANVVSEMDVKIMQLSWVYDINFKPSFDYLLRNRFLEKIYNSLPKNDRIIQIYRKVKVYSENKILK